MGVYQLAYNDNKKNKSKGEPRFSQRPADTNEQNKNDRQKKADRRRSKRKRDNYYDDDDDDE